MLVVRFDTLSGKAFSSSSGYAVQFSLCCSITHSMLFYRVMTTCDFTFKSETKKLAQASSDKDLKVAFTHNGDFVYYSSENGRWTPGAGKDDVTHVHCFAVVGDSLPNSVITNMEDLNTPLVEDKGNLCVVPTVLVQHMYLDLVHSHLCEWAFISGFLDQKDLLKIGLKKDSLGVDLRALHDTVFIDTVYDQSLCKKISDHLQELSSCYYKIKSKGYELDDAMLTEYKLFKASFSYCFELINHFYPKVAFLLSFVTNFIIDFDSNKQRNTLEMMRNAFSHQNEILDEGDYKLWSENLKESLFSLTRHELNSVLEAKDTLLLFNIHGGQVKFCTRMKVKTLLKYCITCIHMAWAILNREKWMVFSHEILVKVKEHFSENVYTPAKIRLDYKDKL